MALQQYAKKPPLNIKVGHDSEVFATRLGVGYFPMIGNVGGTKDNPLPSIGGTLQEDNVAIEMAVDPCSSLDEFISKTKDLKTELTKKVEAAGCQVVIEPSVEFSQDVLEMFVPFSMVSGCDPDFNVYTYEENRYPDIMQSTWRHGSGHLHIDCPLAADDASIRNNLVRLCDMLIKAPQWLIEGDVPRNQYVGAIGNFRPKEYGIEYRSSSNIILKYDKALEHAYKFAQYASARAHKSNVNADNVGILKQSMLKGDKDTVRHLISYYGGELIPT